MAKHYAEVKLAYNDIQAFIDAKRFTIKEIYYAINDSYGYGELFVNRRIETIRARGFAFVDRFGIIKPKINDEEKQEDDFKEKYKYKVDDDKEVSLSDMKDYVQGDAEFTDD